MSSCEETGVIDYKKIDALRNMNEVEEIWKQMLSSFPTSFFLSWEWISTWLITLPKDTKIDLFVGHMDEEPVLAFFIGNQNITRHKMFRYRTASLNSTNDEHLDEISIECNGAVVAPGLTVNIVKEICEATTGWDELYLPGVSDELSSHLEQIMGHYRDTHNIFVERDDRSHYVDLKKVREAGLDYLALLSPNRRQQIRRSIKEYEKQGEITLKQANTENEAMEMLNALAALHQKEWNKRGEPGAFSNGYFLDFHQTLIQHHFSSGIIQIIHIRTSESTIGYLYNYVYDNDVLFYQCGFNYAKSNHARPGLISHYLAILMNARLGHDSYDFLAGNSQYKKSLATDHYRMMWVRLQKKSVRSWIESRLKDIYSNTKISNRKTK